MSKPPLETDREFGEIHIEEVNDPGIFRWLIALASTLVVAGALYFADLASTGFHFAQLNHELQQELAQTDDPSKVLLKEKFKPFLEERKLQLSTAMGIYSQIKSNNISQAFAWSDDARLPKTKTQEQLVEKLEEILKRSKSKTDFNLQRDKVLEGKIELAKEHLILASEFAGLLGFESESLDLLTRSQKIRSLEDAEQIGISFYKDGVFADYPVISKMPDGVPNYLRVEQHLEDATRARVIGQLVRKKSKLRKELLAFKDKGKPLRDSIHKLEDDFETIDDNADAYLQEREEERAEAVDLAGTYIQELVRPKIDPKVLKAYENLRLYSAKWFGAQLPKLASV